MRLHHCRSTENQPVSNIYLGLDVHQDAITVAVLRAPAPGRTRVEQLPNDLAKVRRCLARVAAEGELLVCYEASGAGYVLSRALPGWGYPPRHSFLRSPASTANMIGMM